MERAVEMLIYQRVMIEQFSEDLHNKADLVADVKRSDEIRAIAVMLANHGNALSEISAIVELEGARRAA